MDSDDLRSTFKDAPSSTGPEIDAQARAWLARMGVEVSAGSGDAVVLTAIYSDEDGALHAYAVPASGFDAQAHADLAAVHKSAFEHFFTADLSAEQYAGALRMSGGASDEPDVFEELIDEVREEFEDAEVDCDFDALIESCGSWRRFEVSSGQTLSGPISHLYAVNKCM